ncbi:unnamed protein product [Ectocarpus fasciculatus]
MYIADPRIKCRYSPPCARSTKLHCLRERCLIILTVYVWGTWIQDPICRVYVCGGVYAIGGPSAGPLVRARACGCSLMGDGSVLREHVCVIIKDKTSSASVLG